ncbi:hypothetical protein YC2023_039648 [Brassica napus]|uniref:(rape) hypothetical protein n=1 Tax=Brassica napus TaxID=3708 RepID=A0A816ICC9_BRANA|nr:unnamed protein product [Brassica napus]
MEGVEVINGLGCKMSCSSYKVNSESILKPNRYEISEDFFHRKKKQKKKSENLAHDKFRRISSTGWCLARNFEVITELCFKRGEARNG